MVFNSVVFLFCFLPLSLLLYYLVPGRAKNAVLLAESLIFYCWTGAAFLPLIAVLIVFNYLWALLTAKAKAKLRGLLPLAAVLVNLGVLVYFKYANFLIDTLNDRPTFFTCSSGTPICTAPAARHRPRSLRFYGNKKMRPIPQNAGSGAADYCRVVGRVI